MLHQTLIPPFSSFPSSPSLLQPPPRPLPSLPCSHSSSQVEKEGRMESPQNSFQPQTLCSGLNGDEAAWALERGNILGDDFLVDDLLDLGGLTEPEPETEEAEENEKKFTETEFNEEDNSNSSSSSAVSFEPSPVSEISLPAHDEAELEWVSRIMDDSLSEFPPCSGVPPYNPAPKTQTHVPSLTSTTVPVKAKRSKRTRTPSGVWSMWGPSPVADSTSTTTTTTTTTSSSSSCSSSSYSSYLIYDHTSSLLISGNPPPLEKQKPKKRGRKPKPPQTPSAAGNVSAGGGERRCSHCGVTKTPQWRAGPMGAKTLCNACGVRYKSGRLLPEYRPACSPTFISQVHSNSHRKVLEMRRKKEEEVLLPPPRRRLPPFDPDRTGCVHFGPLKVICNGLDF